MKKILIMGLPRQGKTFLANALVPLLNAVHFNADEVRAEINKDLGFSNEDRVEQARRMGWLCDQVVKAGHYAVADFVCPTHETRAAFGECFRVYVTTGKASPYADTVTMFEPPDWTHYNVYTQDAEFHARIIQSLLKEVESPTPYFGFDWRAPTALFLGRYQPFHEGHKTLVAEGITRVGQACIAVRDTTDTDEKNPFDFEFVRSRIHEMMTEHKGKYVVVQVPNITNVFYGRDVGYSVERIDLPEAIQAISATKIRAKMKKA